MFDFSHHAIEMCCALLEVCGRYLFRTPETHIRTRVLLEQMMRKRTVKPLEQRYSTAIDNAYYSCNPPEVEKVITNYLNDLFFISWSKSPNLVALNIKSFGFPKGQHYLQSTTLHTLN